MLDSQRNVIDNQRDVTQAEVDYNDQIADYNIALAAAAPATGLDAIVPAPFLLICPPHPPPEKT